MKVFYFSLLFSILGCASTQTNTLAFKEDFVSIQDLDPTIIVEARYFSSHNFLGRKVNGYKADKCMLTKRAALALVEVQKDLKKSSLSLKVYDCYRPQKAVDDFVQWAKDLKDTKMKKEFYPKVDKAVLFKEGYIAEKSGHSRGSTIDLTLVSLPAKSQEKYTDGQNLKECYLPSGKRFKDNSLDMGTGYDCFDPLANTENPAVGKKQMQNRMTLKTAMEKHGFKNYDKEWWHYTLKDEPYPETFFDFDIE